MFLIFLPLFFFFSTNLTCDQFFRMQPHKERLYSGEETCTPNNILYFSSLDNFKNI